MSKVVTESSDYLIVTNPASEAPHNQCYQLVNKVYDVIEVETQLLPQAYEYLEQLQSAVDKFRADEMAVQAARKEAEEARIANSH